MPVIVAVNKIDKPDANPDRIKQQLTEYGLQPEEWGGQTQYVEVSALKRTGIDELLEAISLQAEILDLRAPVDRPAPSAPSSSRGSTAAAARSRPFSSKKGDAQARRLLRLRRDRRPRARDESTTQGATIKKRRPVDAGRDHRPGRRAVGRRPFVVVEDPSKSGAGAPSVRRETTRKSSQATTTRMSLEDLQRQVAAGNVNELEQVIIKADVDGSVEALKQALEKLSNDEVTLRVIHSGVGAISESDVQLAMASNAIIVGFHVRPEGKARAARRARGRRHPPAHGHLRADRRGEGGARRPARPGVRRRSTRAAPRCATPSRSRAVDDRRLLRARRQRSRATARAALLRDGRVVHTGSIGSLRRFKDDAREVQAGYECGIGIERFNDVKVGDVIECFRMDEIKRTLTSPKSSTPRPGAGVIAGRDADSHGRRGAWKLVLYLPENHSLKGKRAVLRSIKRACRTSSTSRMAEVRRPRQLADASCSASRRSATTATTSTAACARCRASSTDARPGRAGRRGVRVRQLLTGARGK